MKRMDRKTREAIKKELIQQLELSGGKLPILDIKKLVRKFTNGYIMTTEEVASLVEEIPCQYVAECGSIFKLPEQLGEGLVIEDAIAYTIQIPGGSIKGRSPKKIIIIP